jgi:hypothetical protein
MDKELIFLLKKWDSNEKEKLKRRQCLENEAYE